MAHPNVTVANLIVTALNHASRSWQTPTSQFTAVRRHLAKFQREELSSLTVSVVGPDFTQARVTRAVHDTTIPVLVDFMKLTNDTTLTTEVDALLDLIGAVADYFTNTGSSGLLALDSTWAVTAVEYEDGIAWDWDALYEKGIFQSSLRLTVQGVR